MIKKAIIFTVILISLLLSSILVTVNLINYNSIKDNIADILKVAPQNIKNIKIIKFPVPYITIDQIDEPKVITLKNIKMRFTPWSLLIFRPKISDISLYNATIYSDEQDFDIINHDRLVSKLISKYTMTIDNIKFKIKTLNILNSNQQPILSLGNCSLFEKYPNTAIFKGEVDIGNIGYVGTLSGTLVKNADQTNLNLKVINDDYNFHLMETYQDVKLVNGKAEYLIHNLANILHVLIPDLDHLLRKINQDEEINISFNIIPATQQLKLENITINSKAFSGEGRMDLSKSNNITSNIRLHFPKIDAQSLISSSNNINQFSNAFFGLRFIFGNESILTDISVDQIILADNEVLNNTKFLLNLSKGVLVVNDFSGIIKSGGAFRINGKVTQNTVRTIFDGKIYLQHNDLNSVLSTLGYKQTTTAKPMAFILSSDLKLTLIDVYLQNLMLKTDTTKVTGDITSRFIGFMPHFIANLNFSSIDLNRNDYPIISPMINFAKSLSENMKDQSYFAKYIPIRTVDYLGNFDITINDLFFGEKSFGKTYILANISPANIEINNLDIRTNTDYVNLSAHLLASDIKPQLNITINDGSVNVNFLTPIDLLNLRNKLLDEFDLEKLELKLDCALSQLTQNDLVLQNVKLALANNNTLFNIDNIEANLLSGKLKAAGSVLLEPYSLNFVYAANSIDLAQLSNILPKWLLDNYGGMSINGTFSAHGNSLKEILYEFSTQSEFVVKNSKISNFSVDSLIEKINTKGYNLKYLKNDLAVAMVQGQTEIDNLRGKVELKNGIVTIPNLVFNTKYTSGSASLLMNIYNLDMVSSAMLSFYAPNFPSIQNEPINLKITTSGTILNPIKLASEDDLKKALGNRVVAK